MAAAGAVVPLAPAEDAAGPASTDVITIAIRCVLQGLDLQSSAGFHSGVPLAGTWLRQLI